MGNIIEQIINCYGDAKKRLLLLDYDGTLTPLQTHPSLAQPSAPLLALLQRLADDPKNTVVIISGRDQPTLHDWLGHLPLTFVAEHGSFMKTPTKDWHALLAHTVDWKRDIRPHLEASAANVTHSFVEEKITSLVWHYRQADQKQAQAELAHLRAQLLPHTQKHELILTKGPKHLEVRVTGTNKGTASALLVRQKKWDFILAIGDEPTDEDMFAALPTTAFSLKIGTGPTTAAGRLKNSAACLALLTTLDNQ